MKNNSKYYQDDHNSKLTDNIVVLKQFSAAKSVLTGAAALGAALVNANEVVDVAETTTGAPGRQVALEGGAPAEAARLIRLPANAAEVFLHADASGVPQIGEVPGSAFHLIKKEN